MQPTTSNQHHFNIHHYRSHLNKKNKKFAHFHQISLSNSPPNYTHTYQFTPKISPTPLINLKSIKEPISFTFTSPSSLPSQSSQNICPNQNSSPVPPLFIPPVQSSSSIRSSKQFIPKKIISNTKKQKIMRSQSLKLSHSLQFSFQDLSEENLSYQQHQSASYSLLEPTSYEPSEIFLNQNRTDKKQRKLSRAQTQRSYALQCLQSENSWRGNNRCLLDKMFKKKKIFQTSIGSIEREDSSLMSSCQAFRELFPETQSKAQ